MVETDQEHMHKSTMAMVDYKAVTFTLAGKDYGVDIMSVREISRGGRFTYVPNTPHFVRGVYNLRGEIIPIVDLRQFFGLPVHKDEKVEGILICRVKNTTLGLVVDSIEKVVGIDRRDIQPAHPMFAEINIQYIEGIIDREDRLYVLLNIHQIFGIAKDLMDDELAKEEAHEEEVAAVPAPAQPEPTASTPTPSTPATPTSQPTSQSFVKTPEVIEPFVAVEQEIPASVQVEPDAQTQALLDMLNNMPEPNADILIQPDIEDLLSDGKHHTRRVTFKGDERGWEQLVADLADLISFRVTHINENWIAQRANEYLDKGKSLELNEEDDALRFLKGFFSAKTGQLWSKEMMDELNDHLSPQEKGIYHIWNPGCATGHESYSVLGTVLVNGVSNTPKVYAQDIDLILASQAPHLTFESHELPENFDMLMTESTQGLQFKNEYKNFIIFEYADVVNVQNFPGINLIVARDILSYLTEDEIQNFLEVANNGAEIGTVMVLGDHEELHDQKWKPVDSQYLSIYKKIE
ncbi:chemotaxis protein CheW [Entomospira culicis]|uniref:Chemotaxis protein CheW n=1 Tax=Entomospira culicis TaxID=2719989 RepID=A0A968GJ81_9SPIO|nr:chemotaxis protein CheW [Entomospira culicis]NIZ18630.1 hypothetical protein [Entomospira culicis]NIZ68845.1 hypothetical protein [Entomospira culicis]WDI37439.1 chemotaxis protein CheW [Entomospira culicis]WDI39067.1 chemotaxis protein CheW [Entomospira culicis]